LRSFIQKGAFDVCLFQETKKASFENYLIHNLWGHSDVGWVFQESAGMSGGLLIVWNSNTFKFLSSFSGHGFLGIKVERDGVVLNIVNVYSPCSMAGKKQLWGDLVSLKQSSGETEWCLGGDFNAVLLASERFGSSAVGRQGERILFNRFIEDLEVIDVPVLGKKFSWFSADGKSMSRIDRFLLSDGFITSQGISGQWIGDRDISDHCPIWLVSSPVNWGPKPFRVINGWMEHPELYSFVENAWKGFSVHGKKAFVLKEKFKLLRECLRKWNREVFGILDLNIDKTVKELNDIESNLDGANGAVALTRREGLNREFWNQLHFKESLLKQKSRVKWVKEGDSNSRFFHESIKNRRRRNQLVALKNGEQWVEGVDEVKGFVKSYFENNFKERWDNRPTLNGIQFQTISEEDNLLLTAPFSCEEVKEAIWNSDGNKCPGPDGFNFNFLKFCWEFIKGDIMDFFHEFHSTAILPKAITASFLTLIPKKDHPQVLSDYRPICLVSGIYKLLSKVLATRLKVVMSKVISKIQSAFLPNRQILDGVLVINELLDLAKRRKDKCLFFKVDFERAYDTVSWKFLDYMMVRMGFGEVWRRWISACIFQSSMSVLVNGSPTDDFIVGKGLRQGDPLSPFLFLIVAEGLTGLMGKAVDNNVFHGYKVSNSILFHTLQFADDTIIMGEGNWDNLWTIKTVLRSFEIVSGLKVNFHKSKLYGMNLDNRFLGASSSFLHCEVDSIPFRFLGIPVGANPRRKATWSSIIDTTRKRLSVWNGRNLSIGGRVTLINSVLSSLPLYFFSFFKAPVCVLKELVSIQRRFLWGGWLGY
jgi:exonuclease III